MEREKETLPKLSMNTYTVHILREDASAYLGSWSYTSA